MSGGIGARRADSGTSPAGAHKIRNNCDWNSVEFSSRKNPSQANSRALSSAIRNVPILSALEKCPLDLLLSQLRFPWSRLKRRPRKMRRLQLPAPAPVVASFPDNSSAMDDRPCLPRDRLPQNLVVIRVGRDGRFQLGGRAPAHDVPITGG